MLRISDEWDDYQCIASGDGEKLEKWGNYVLRRPDPQIIWNKSNSKIWDNCDAFYHRSDKGGGSWEFRKKLPNDWTINYKNLTFKVSPTNFKHTGIFPEQAVNWDYVMDKIRNSNIKDFDYESTWYENMRRRNIIKYRGRIVFNIKRIQVFP